MKKMALILIGFSCVFSIFAQKNVEYSVNKADMYLSGAKIYSQSQIELGAGTHTVIVKNITNYLIQGTIQAKMSGDANIISVNPSRNYIQPGDLTKREQELYDLQKELTQQLSLLTIDQETVEEEHALIITLIESDTHRTEGENYSVAELKELSEFYRVKVSELKKNNFQIEQKITTVREELERINAQLREERSVKDKNNWQVELSVHVTNPGKKVIELSYFISNCGWTPQYDIKAKSKDDPIEVVYKASVWQATGVDWNQTEITLMTNQPAQDQNRPILSPLYVDAKIPYSPPPVARESYKMLDAVQLNMLEYADEEIMAEEPYYAEAVSTDINMTYHIQGIQAIPGNGKSKILTMDVKNIPARFVYHAVPKLNEQVYLLAYIPGWHNLNLINGVAGIYMQDAFIGNVDVNTRFTGEEYPLSFGIDNRITIKRNKKQDFSSETKVSSDKREKLSYEFIVRNNLSTNIEIEILDQLPISKNKNVKVMLEDQGGAEYMESIGLLKWVLPVAAGKSNSAKFSYEMRYPKDHVLEYTAY